jgi:hypothetical protein
MVLLPDTSSLTEKRYCISDQTYLPYFISLVCYPVVNFSVIYT